MKRNLFIAQPVLGEEEWEALKEPLYSGWVTQGPKVSEFEKLFAERHQVKQALACTSATTALHLALVALDIGQGDEVLVPSFTWIATANVVLYCGAKPVLVDIDLSTFNIDADDIARKLTDNTKAIIAVHLFGLCADMDAIKAVAPDVPIIEDAACAAGAGYKGSPAGALGDLGCFSFHPRKSITTGEGGMVTTNNEALSEKVNMLRNHGASISEEQRHHGPKPFILPDFNILGFNYRMTDLQGAVGVVQMGKLDKLIDERHEAAVAYNEALSEIDWIQTPELNDDYRHGWQSYVLLIDEAKAPMGRNEMMEKLQEQGVSTRPGTHAVHMLGLYAGKYGYKPDDLPNSKTANNCTMAIPLHNNMSKEDYEYVVDMIKSL
ncbi:MAG TPA: DegT/DnrJ/EryC1/StrS family aminotransferase [Flavobacteriales bacterium]|nr:DegT/DnrJ/EryC1/StrS family aminotransferase [Flavobacteriales bacterium]HIO68575.1 DegT/DnrJ/EryC1/StrS family aminotransferase [Flavobacteriales bacterium]